MKIEQTTLQKTFVIRYKGKTYLVDYLDSDGQTIRLLNRDYWEVYDENSEELQIYIFKESTKKEKILIDKNIKLKERLVEFCIKHFEDYKPRKK